MMLKLRKLDYRLFYIPVIGILILFLFTHDTPFFWDALSKSKRATWFYEHDFSQFVVPDHINSGHPPLWTLSLALLWKFFGRNLLVTRLYLLILNIMVAFQLSCVIQKYAKSGIHILAYLVVFIDPTYIAQTTILNNDVLMLFFCLLAINQSEKNRVLYGMALTGILFCNLRGMFFVTGFFLYEGYKIIENRKFQIKDVFNAFKVFVIPVLVFGLFLIYQYQTVGWVIRSPMTSFNSHRQIVGFQQLIKNGFAIVWNFMDYGRFVFLLLTFWALVIDFRNRVLDMKTQNLLKITISLVIPILTLMLLSSNPIGPRYFMLFYLLLLILFVNILSGKEWIKIAVVSVFLISGHFWIYPKTLPQGWDSSLAYLNYFDVKDEMEAYILDQDINLKKISTYDANCSSYIERLEDDGSPVFVRGEMGLTPYYLYSNIENSTSDEQIEKLYTHWIKVKECKKGGIIISLFKSPE